jgi:N-acetylneuraminic acid mutarotase
MVYLNRIPISCYFKQCIFCLLIFANLFSQAQTWEISEMASIPESVTNNAVVEGFINDTTFVFSFGGLDSTKKYSGIHLRSFRYNTVTEKWNMIPSIPDTLGKIAAAASRVGNVIYVIGGYHVFASGNEKSSNKVHRYDVLNNTWLPDGTPLPVPIDDHVQAVWRDSLIFVITGWSNTKNVPHVQIYNPAKNQWATGTPVPDNLVYNAFGASGVIKGDTIYYFGGAKMSANFPVQNNLRMGIINPNNPTQITWSDTVPGFSVFGYRMASTLAFGRPHWFGGSNKTYNYDGIAYNGSGGVSPNNRILFLNSNQQWQSKTLTEIPMDLRGMANLNDSMKYIAGGMLGNQKVSDKLLLLKWKKSPTGISKRLIIDDFKVFPNPADDYLIIQIRADIKPAEVKYEIADSLGKILLSGDLATRENKIPTSQLQSGLYYVNLLQQYRMIVQKIVIKH